MTPRLKTETPERIFQAQVIALEHIGHYLMKEVQPRRKAIMLARLQLIKPTFCASAH